MSDSLLFRFAFFVGRPFALVVRVPLRSSYRFGFFPFPFRALSLPSFAFIFLGFLGLNGEEAVETPLLFRAEELLEFLCTFSYTFFTVRRKLYQKVNDRTEWSQT